MWMIAEGKAAPAFDCEADDGSKLNQATLRGRIVVLYFYPADDTETCTLEAQQFSARSREFAAIGALVIGVSPDGIASHCKFRDKYGLAVKLISDPDLRLCKAYGVWQLKTLFGRTYMGIERTSVLIDKKATITRIWRKVRLKGHVEAVLAAAKTLAQGDRHT
jgi:thioredoxin-dependent peroxiredoxin